jgi:hypothetical protein
MGLERKETKFSTNLKWTKSPKDGNKGKSKCQQVNEIKKELKRDGIDSLPKLEDRSNYSASYGSIPADF